MTKEIEDYDFDAEIVGYPSWYDYPDEYDESPSYFCLECDNELHFVDNTDDLICSECNTIHILDRDELFVFSE